MKRLIVLLAACSAPTKDKLPSAAIAPDLQTRTTTNACATDISYDGKRVDISYRYSYDELGRLASARGRYAIGIEDHMTYEWDNLDQMQRYLYMRAADGARSETTAQYSTLGDLLEYTRTRIDGGYRDERRHVYSAFTDNGQPTREQLTVDGASEMYQLDYDAMGRIARTAPEAGGVATIYTYDDDARTITIDTGRGAWRGVIVFDEANRRLSETWDGTGASVIASQELYEWSGDRLRTITYRQGSEFAPHELTTVEIHTYSYNCPL
ncbi:MAG: hypothetical protein M4D80_24845 [Myxococcota bacterium]|nr:hypothetical protein [Deltaproteobacteria bacterium]MDQ3338407.1 hypothetical protein [Myxococcota bacterium]